MAKKYIDATILAEWLEKRAEIYGYRTRVGYELAAAEIECIGEYILPSSDPLSTDIIHTSEDLDCLFRKYEKDNPYVPTEEEERKNKIGKFFEKTVYCIAAVLVLLILIFSLL